MKWLFAVLSSLLCLATTFGNDWELVYPLQVPIKDEMPFNCIFSDGSAVPIGSNAGYVIADLDHPLENAPAFDPDRARAINLENVSFPITTISKTALGWIVAGENGDMAIHEVTVPGSESVYDNFSLNWKVATGLPGEVHGIASIDDIVLLIAGTHLIRLLDSDLHWIDVSAFPNVLQIAAFNNEFYILVKTASDVDLIELYRSADGLSWEHVWSVAGEKVDFPTMNVGLDTIDHQGASNNNRLYLNALIEGSNFSHASLTLSTTDGTLWLDHSSTQTRTTNFGDETSPWNPLSLDKSQRGFPRSGFHFHPASGRLRIGYFDSLEYFNGADWEIIFISRQLETSQTNLAAWGEISFLSPINWMRTKLVTIARDGSISETSTPTIFEPAPPPGSMGIAWYAWFEIGGRKFTCTSSIGWHLFYLSDNQTWSIVPGVGENDLRNYSVEDGKLITLENNQLFAWSDTAWSEGIAYSGQPSDFSYVESTCTWYGISRNDRSVAIQSLKDPATFAAFSPEQSDTVLYELSSPDDEVLIAYGNTSEFAVIGINGSVKLRTIPQFIDNIESVDYVNGWFYFHGIRTFRSRDFEQFEMVSPPLGQSLVRVLGFGNDLYGFAVNGRVFKRPLDKGFLDSIQMKQGWHHADWLGKFQIIDQELGDINHLLLGKCWVKQVSELEYWIRTEPLGWIYMRKDWSPWFMRMDDAHWYWLDHDTWPGRAWDDKDQEWEELEL